MSRASCNQIRFINNDVLYNILKYCMLPGRDHGGCDNLGGSVRRIPGNGNVDKKDSGICTGGGRKLPQIPKHHSKVFLNNVFSKCK